MPPGPADRWREQLEAWALPPRLLEQAAESPYGWPATLLRRRNEAGLGSAPDPTRGVIAEHLPPAGLLVDVGAGTGRVSIDFAGAGYRLAAVEPNAEMANVLRHEAAERSVEIDIIEQPWPQAAHRLSPADVVVCAHVVYDVAEIAPFVAALDGAAPVVVIELTSRHPWSDLAPLYKALHGLDRPEGPTLELFVDVVGEAVGRTPAVIEWKRPPSLYFESWTEILSYYRKRLLVGQERDAELRDLLAPQVAWSGGRATVGSPRSLATVWWKSA